MEYRYKHDFFSGNIHFFERYLSRYVDNPTVFLEIGSLEGRSTIWLLENILTHEASHIICIDLNKHNTLGNLTYNTKLKFKDKVDIIVGNSNKVLSDLISDRLLFDFIYIDGQHDEYMPLNDLVMSHQLLKVGGILALDDYLAEDSREYGNFTTRKCFNYFIDIYYSYYKRYTLESDYQQWCEKIA